MRAFLEIWSPDQRRLIPLTADLVSVGAREENDLALADDPEVFPLHCAFIRYAGGWCLRDLGSENGSYVNGRRICGEHPVWPDDEITIGNTKIHFRSEDASPQPVAAERTDPLPFLTRREHEVLLALCRPLATGNAFTGPASVQAVAEELRVSEAAVRQHLLRLAQKLGVRGKGEQRRIAIANEAIRRRAVHLPELRQRGR